MVKSETISDKYIKHISDAGKKIRQIETGRLYEEAIDVIPCRFTYEETDITIDTGNKATENDFVNALEELGVKFNG
jgi:hypothetical protein